MSKNKSFFQKLSDSFTSIFPFNSTAKELPNLSQVSFDKNLSPIRYQSNRRLASEAFGKDDDDIKIKRAKLHHDPLSLPSSRIIKQTVIQNSEKNLYNNNFNDAASDFSDVSVSTSGVSSLHPRSSKRITLGNIDDATLQPSIRYPRNLNLSQKMISPASIKPLKCANDFMSSPARKILEKLDRLTTPITASDRLSSIVVRDRCTKSFNNPYARPAPPISGKKPVPLKAVTVSASSNDMSKSTCGPIRRKQTQKIKKLGYTDDIDLDSEIDHETSTMPKFSEHTQINFSNLPLLKKSISTNTDESFFSRPQRESSPGLDFTFSNPATVNDEGYSCAKEKTHSYQFKSKIPEDEIQHYDKRFMKSSYKSNSLWRCETCLKENTDDCDECTNCGNLFTKNKNHVVLLKETMPVDNDKSANLNKMIENEKGVKSDTVQTKEKISFPTIKSQESTSNSIGFGFPTSSNASTLSSPSVTSQSSTFNIGFNSSSEVKPSTSLFSNSNAELKTSVGSSSFSPFQFSSPTVASSNDSTKLPIVDIKKPESNNSTSFAFGFNKSSNPTVDHANTLTSSVSETPSNAITFGITNDVKSSSAEKSQFGLATSSEASNVVKFGITNDVKSFSADKSQFGVPSSSTPSVSAPTFPSFGSAKSGISLSAAPLSTISTSSSPLASSNVSATNVSASPLTSFTFGKTTVTSTEKPEIKATVSTTSSVSFSLSSSSTEKPEMTTASSTASSVPFSFGKSISTSSSKPEIDVAAPTNSSGVFTFGRLNAQTPETNKSESGILTSSIGFGQSSTIPSFGTVKPVISASAISSAPFSLTNTQPVMSFGQNKSTIEVPASSTSSPFVFGNISNATTNENAAPKSIFEFSKSSDSNVIGFESNKPINFSPLTTQNPSVFSQLPSSESKIAFPISSQSVNAKANPSTFSFGDNLKAVTENGTSSLFTASASTGSNGSLFGSVQSQSTSSSIPSSSFSNSANNIFAPKTSDPSKSVLFGFNNSTTPSSSSIFSTTSTPFAAATNSFSGAGGFFNNQSKNTSGANNAIFGNNGGAAPNANAFNVPVFNTNTAFDGIASNSGNMFNFNAAGNTNAIAESDSNPFNFKSAENRSSLPLGGMGSSSAQVAPSQRKLMKGRRMRK